MPLFSRLSNAWRTLFRKSALERELDDELRAALDTLVDRYVAEGLSEESARRAAHLALGGVEPIKDAVRDVRAGAQIESVLSDIRYALRLLRKSPAFTAAAVLSLALGIGANTAIFTFINALLLRPLPVPDASSLVEVSAARKDGHGFLSFPMYRDLAVRQQVLTGIVATAGETPTRVTIPSSTGSSSEVDNVRISFVSGNYFSLLGVDPVAGRLFSPDDDRNPDSASIAGSVVVLSDAFWERQFGRDLSVVGRTILIGRVRCEVIGVAPRGFVGEIIGNAADGWVPLTTFSSRDDLDNRRGAFTAYFGRLTPGIGAGEAQASLTLTFQQLLAAEGLTKVPPEQYSIVLESAAAGLDFSMRRTYLKPLFIVMGMVAVVLLIACANVANLLLARAAARTGEISVRLALGCSRSRLVRQLLTESLLLSVTGALAGLLVSRWTSQTLGEMALRGPVGLRLNLSPDGRVFVFLAVLSVATAIAFGLVPALRSTCVDLAPALKGLRRGGGQMTKQRASRFLVICQVALSMLLLIGAGLLVRSFQKLHQQDLGFATGHVFIFSLGHGPADRTPTAMAAVEKTARQRIAALPGVASASFSGFMIFSPSDVGSPFTIPGYQPPSGEPLTARYDSVSPGHFETLGMTMVAGRTFEERDDAVDAPAVTVVNESFARRFLAERPVDAIGRTIVLRPNGSRGKAVDGAGRRYVPGADGNPDKKFEVVGVVHDAKYNNLREPPKPLFYLPYAQMTRSLRSLEVRTSRPVSAVAGPIRDALSTVTKDIMIRGIVPLAEQVDQSLAAEQLLLRLCVLFGGLALLLACVGLYGVIAYSVAQRSTEIGVRVALGATPSSVMRGVLRDTLVLVVAGMVIGIPAALAAGRLLITFLYGLTPRDPVTLAWATVTLLASAALAGALPALRAARIDPNVALRYE
jgi:predicted permease